MKGSVMARKSFACLMSFCVAAFCVASEDCLVAHWSMDKVEDGKVIDVSGNGNDASIVGSLAFEDCDTGKAAIFDGSGKGYLRVGSSKSLDGLTEFTIAFKVKFSDLFAVDGHTDGYPVIISRGEHGKEYPSLLLTAGFHSKNTTTFKRICDWFRTPDSTVDRVLGSKHMEWEKNRWYDISMDVDSKKGTFKFQRDGRTEGEGDTPPGYSSGFGDMFIGACKSRGFANMKGSIDDVKMYDNSLKSISCSTINASRIGNGTLKLDGDLSDLAWRNAPPTGDFVLTGKPDAKPRKRSSCRILYDDEYLYLGLRFQEPDTASMKGEYVNHDDPVWNDDSAGIFIGAPSDPKSYYHFMFNACGARFEEKVLNARDIIREWDADWKASAKRGDGEWTAEVAIPFKCLELPQPPVSGSLLRISVNRIEKGVPENSGWPNGCFHQPEKFGSMVFDTYKNAMAQRIKRLRATEDEIKESLSALNCAGLVLTPKVEAVLSVAEGSLSRLEGDAAKVDGDVSGRFWSFADRQLGILRERLLALKFEVKGKALLAEMRSNPDALDGKGRLHFKREMLELSRECGSAAAGLYETKEECSKIKSEYWRALSGRPYACWEKSPWTNLPADQFPDISDEECRSLKISMGINERDQAAFAITNFTGGELKMRIAASEACGLKTTVREAYQVKVENGEVVNDALPLLETLTIPPLQSREVWVLVDSHDAKPGGYSFDLSVSPCGMEEAKIKVDVDVFQVEFPKTPKELPVFSSTWDYIAGLGDPTLREAAKKDLMEHHVNVPYLSVDTLPTPVFDKTGGMKVDYSKLDKALDFWKGDAKTIGIYWGLMRGGYNDMRRRFGVEGEYMKEAWKGRFSLWYRDFSSHIAGKGLSYDDFFFHTFDETTKPEAAEFFSFLKDVDPKARLFLNPCGTSVRTSGEMTSVNPYIDIWCPWFASFKRRDSDMAFMRSKGEGFWIYNNPNIRIYRLASPYGHYRLTFWNAWNCGAKGCSIWCYLWSAFETPMTVWNEQAAKNVSFDLVYLSKDAPSDVSRKEMIIPSKRWEAWREGAEDFTYLSMLKDAIERHRGDVDQRLIEDAKDILDRMPQSVCEQYSSVFLADSVKKKVLTAICKINGSRRQP